MSRSRILLVIAALGTVAVLARLLFPGAAATERAHEEQAAAETAEAAPNAMPDTEVAPPPAPAPEQGADETIAAIAKSKAQLETAATLREKARFPPTSRRIEDNLDPIVRTRAVKERVNPLGQGRKPALVVFASSLSYEAPSPIILYAKFIREHPDDWSLRTDAEIAGELVNAAGAVVAQVDLRDDGQDRDIEAHDGVFTAQLTPPAEELDQWTGLIRVKIYGETEDGDRRSARTRFYYGAPAARLTGYYQDALVDGHLQILAEIEVQQAGQYRLDATVSGSHGLIAWSENTVWFEPGIGSLPLTFWGLAFREANEPGPYRLSSVALANVTVTPPQLNDATSTNYETAPYKPQDFSNERYNDPKLLQRADRIEARARGETSGR
jgi:hypothetical protein